MNQTAVAVRACDGYIYDKVRCALREAIDAVGGFDFLRPGMKVALKVNLVSSMAAEKAATTHPVVIRALCDMLCERGATVVIGDSPGGLYTASYVGHVYSATGVRDCVRDGVTLNDNFSQKEANFPEGKQARHFTYTGYLDDADAMIDVCKLKTHGMMGYSGAVKNLFGTVPGTCKPEYHFRYPSYEAFADMLVDLNEYFRPVLSVCDAIVGMEGNGPTAGEPRNIGCLLVSRSSHALDLLATRLIGLGKDAVPTLKAAYDRGLIPATAEELSVDGNWQAFVIDDYKNIAVRHSLGFKGTSDSVIKNIFGSAVGAVLTAKPKLKTSLCVGCNMCGRVCPAGAIAMVKGKAHIDRKKCIRCFCCQEFCPKGAMKVHRTWVARLANHG